MLPRNSKLAGKIVKSLKGVPKQQRTTAILAMESFYKEHEFINEVSEIESTKMENAVRRIKFPQVKLNEFDEEIMQIISEESSRQFKSIDLIASSNIPIPQMNEVTNLLSNKSSPGFPGKRDFNGDSVIDKVEKLCYKRALDAFSLSQDDWSVNVQTLSGSLANLCAYHSQLKIGETVLSLNTKTGGGHFTHGLVDEHNNGVNLYGQAWNFKHYGLDDNGNINYDEAQEMALKYKPKLIVWGASSHPRDIDYARIRKICDSVGALMMADIAHGFGLVIAGVNKSPFEYADIVTASASKSMRGPRAGLIQFKLKLS